jgi:hypothetical protein
MKLIILILSALLQNSQININGLNPVTSYISDNQVKFLCNGESYAIISYDLINKTISRENISRISFYDDLSNHKKQIVEDDKVKSLVAAKYDLNPNGLSFTLGYKYGSNSIYNLYYEDEINPSLSILAINSDLSFLCQKTSAKIFDIIIIKDRAIVVYETKQGFSLIDYVSNDN